MLTSQLGIRLLLWVGKTVPRPAPPELLRAISRVEVTNNADKDDGFQIMFSLTKQKTGEYDLLQDGTLDPDSRVIIGVIMGAAPEPLMDGIIYHHQLVPGDQPGRSTLTVMGRDVRVMLNLTEVNGRFPNQADSVIVQRILANYAQYGLVPNVTTTTDTPSQNELVPWQHETDLAFINRLAERNGFVFYTEPLTIGTNTAYWGPRDRTGQPQPALSYSLGAASNVRQIHFRNDALAPVAVEGKFTDPITKQSISIPSLPDLRFPPLVVQPVSSRRTLLMRRTANRSASRAAVDLLARKANAPDAVICTGTLDSVRYGFVLRARRLVGVRGAGRAYDGTYYVQEVKHMLTLTGYTQEFSLQREGTGSLLPVVSP
ncbi:MAG TPA: hypothetical protein VL486_03535 [Verrucomicrobiae bacterium]|nr:hypothetical protein [Verrucomicrobiae bacterium]